MEKQNKTEVIRARITQEEMEMIEKYIKDNGIKNRSNLVRLLIVDRIKKEMEENK